MNNKALLNKLNDLTKVLNKLKQKYGKRKLIQYLKDLDPHLSRPQKKINKIFLIICFYYFLRCTFCNKITNISI